MNAPAEDFERFRRNVREHYGLKRQPTDTEVQAELAHLRRRGLANLDDSQLRLAAQAGLAGFDIPVGL